jgi:transposase
MISKFVDADRNTLYMLPPSIQDWLPEDHLARFVVDIVSQLDLKPLKNAYAGVGSRAYDPEMLLCLLFYGYATRVFSSRQIERATYDSVAFRYIACNTHPDHDTIANFRKRFLEQLKALFVSRLGGILAHAMGMFKLGKVSLDGTKVKANASKHHALSSDHACRLEKQLKEEVEALLRMAEEADRANVPDGMDVPEELERRKDRLEAIARAKEEIERRAAERYAKEKEAYESRPGALPST